MLHKPIIESDSSDDEDDDIVSNIGGRSSTQTKEVNQLLQYVQGLIIMSKVLPIKISTPADMHWYERAVALENEEKIMELYQLFTEGKGARLERRISQQRIYRVRSQDQESEFF